MKKVIALFCVLLLSPAGVFAEPLTLDPVVVTATRTSTPLSQIASSVTVITAEEIEAKQQPLVLDLLRSVPGVNILSYGTLGSTSTISLRGASNKHTLVLIDGIEFRDASTISGGPQLENLSTDNIERIEIVRGAQSVLYGSDAIGGVINIITRKGAKKPEFYVSAEGGSYNTWRENLGFTYAHDQAFISFAASKIDSDGFSAANEKDGNSEHDGYENTNISLNLGASPSKIFTLKLTVHSIDSEYEFDAGFPFSDSQELQDSTERNARLEGVLHLLDDKWQIAFGTSITDTDRTVTGSYPADYNGTITKFDLQNTLRIGQQHTLAAGLETEKENADIVSFSLNASGNVRNNAVFLQDQYVAGDFAATLGVRLDAHDEFGSQTTYRLAPTYSFTATGTRLKGAVGTGFRAPSLNELYGNPAIYDYGTVVYNYLNGNRDLNPEKSFGWEVGVEQSFFSSSFILGATYFHNDIDDFIENSLTGIVTVGGVTTYSYQTVNMAELKTSGVETTLDWYPSELLNINLSYTYTDSRESDGSRKDRLPLHKGTLNLTFYPLDALQLNLNAIYTGERYDGSYTDETLKAYTLVNLASSYQLNNNCKIFGRIDNLFDKDHEEVAGYGTAGLSAYAGIKLTF